MLDLFRARNVRPTILAIGVLSLLPMIPVVLTLPAAASASAQGPSRPHGCQVSAVPFWGAIVAEVRWRDTSGDEDGFEVEWWLPGPGSNSWILGDTRTVGADTAQSFMRLGSGRNRYRVRASNGAGVSAWSNWASLTYP